MLTDEQLTWLHNDDGPLDQQRVERIKQLKAENAAMRKIVEWIASELPDYHTIVAIRKEARALLAADEHDGVQ